MLLHLRLALENGLAINMRSTVMIKCVKLPVVVTEGTWRSAKLDDSVWEVRVAALQTLGRLDATALSTQAKEAAQVLYDVLTHEAVQRRGHVEEERV